VRSGVRIALDVGSVRIGVARSDPDGLLAFPLPAVAAGDTAADAVARLVREHAAVEVIVGLPILLSGEAGTAAAAAGAVAREVARLLPGVRVAMVDERLSTTEAGRRLREAGKDTRQSRTAVDSASAVVILHHALELESTSGRPPGTTVSGRPRRRTSREVQ